MAQESPRTQVFPLGRERPGQAPGAKRKALEVGREAVPDAGFMFLLMKSRELGHFLPLAGVEGNQLVPEPCGPLAPGQPSRRVLVGQPLQT